MKRLLTLLVVITATFVANAAAIRGRVVCDGKGVEGVVVTDGIRATRTDAKGQYKLKIDDTRSRLVYISVPSGYEVPSVRGFMPDFYRPIKERERV